MNDIFKLDEKDVKKLINWRDGHKDELRTNENFAFLKGTIEVSKNTKVDKIKAKCSYIDFEVTVENKIIFKYGVLGEKKLELIAFEYKLLMGSLGRTQIINTHKVVPLKDIKNLMEDVIAIYFALNYYSIKNKTIKVVKPLSERKSRKEPLKKIGKTTYAISSISLERIIYLRDCENKEKRALGEVNYEKEEWGVRGFPRHYKKTGKTIWIKPSTRKRRITEKEIIQNAEPRKPMVYTL